MHQLLYLSDSASFQQTIPWSGCVGRRTFADVCVKHKGGGVSYIAKSLYVVKCYGTFTSGFLPVPKWSCMIYIQQFIYFVHHSIGCNGPDLYGKRLFKHTLNWRRHDMAWQFNILFVKLFVFVKLFDRDMGTLFGLNFVLLSKGHLP